MTISTLCLFTPWKGMRCDWITIYSAEYTNNNNSALFTIRWLFTGYSWNCRIWWPTLSFFLLGTLVTTRHLHCLCTIPLPINKPSAPKVNSQIITQTFLPPTSANNNSNPSGCAGRSQPASRPPPTQRTITSEWERENPSGRQIAKFRKSPLGSCHCCDSNTI